MKTILYLIIVLWITGTTAFAQSIWESVLTTDSFQYKANFQPNSIAEDTTLHNTQPFPQQISNRNTVRNRDFPVQTLVQSGNCENKESNIWYFGNYAGIDFNTDPPTPLTNGLMSTYEGCATVCNGDGDLLFYTNGVNVWNKEHFFMQNGTNLNGHASATQSAIIVPKPGVSGIYYIFTVDAVENSFANGACYSIVDISQNNGLGLVTTKNISLVANASERIIATRHCNGKDFWIISHQRNNDTFEAYLLTETGISTSPIRSSAGSRHDSGVWKAAGSMKVSPDGSWLAIAIRNDRTPTSVELFAFNNTTGTLQFSTSFSIINDLAMSVEFSPDNSKLYFSAGTYATTGKVYQVDLSSRNPTQMRNSQMLLASSTSQWWGVLQLAPNGKIYLAKWTSENLGVIHNPNALGTACDFREADFNLNGKSSYLGLPNLMAYTLVPKAPVLIGPTEICLSPTSRIFRVSSMTCGTSATYQWSVSSKASIVSENQTSIAVRFNQIGKDTVIVRSISDCGIQADTLVVTIVEQLPLNIGKDIILCTNSTVVLDAGSNFAVYLWSNNMTSQRITVSSPGKYWVRVENYEGCMLTDTIMVYPANVLPVNIGPDTSSCKPLVRILDAGSGYISYLWQDGSRKQTFTASKPGRYIVRVVDSCGTVSMDTVDISIAGALPPVRLPNDTSFCEQAVLILDAGSGYTSYTWQDGSHQQTFTASQPGTYFVQTIDSCGQVTADTILISPAETMPPVKLGPDISTCAGIQTVLDAGIGYKSYTWQDGSYEQTFTASQPGIYIVQTVDFCDNISTDTLFVEPIEAMPPVKLGPDTSACVGITIVLDAGSGYKSYTWQDDSHEQTFSVSQSGIYTVQTVDFCDNISTDTLRVEAIEAMPPVKLGPDVSFCKNSEVLLDAGPGYTSYTWQDNSHGQTFTTGTPGTYFVETVDICGNISSDTIIVVLSSSIIQATPDTTICDGTSIQLFATGAQSYTWFPITGLDKPSSATPTASLSRTTTYTVTGITAEGCTTTTTLTITVFNAPDFQLSLPDTTAAPGTRIALPLRLSLAPSRLPFYVDNLSLSVRFRSSIFQADSLTNGTFAITTGQQEILHIELHDFLLTQQNSTLTTIHGTVYLGNTSSTPLELIHLQLNGCPLSPVANGSITPDSVCSIALRRIQPLGETSTLLTVSPNPVSEAAEISVTTAEQGEHLLSVYNLQGQLLWRESFRHNGSRNTHTISMETYQLGTGLYQIVLTSPTRVRTQNMSVIR